MSLLSQTLKNHYEATVGSRSRSYSFVVMPDGQISNHPLSILNLPNIGNKGMNNGVFAVIPGSFNPLHIAHRKIFDGVTKLYAPIKEVIPVFELSIHRKGKEPLSFEDLLNRLEQFEWYAPVWVTNALLFFEKTGLVSQWVRPSFQVGYDTAERLLNDHGVNGVGGMEANFVVYPRMIDGVVCDIQTLTDKHGFLPHNMYMGPKLSKEEMSVSSTAIRNNTKMITGPSPFKVVKEEPWNMWFCEGPYQSGNKWETEEKAIQECRLLNSVYNTGYYANVDQRRLAELESDVANAYKCAKDHVPDYPWSDDPDKDCQASTAVWACGTAYEGVSKACDRWIMLFAHLAPNAYNALLRMSIADPQSYNALVKKLEDEHRKKT